ncbi:MAG: discoidin domain-containing protein [Myxococcaceae bacterium]
MSEIAPVPAAEPVSQPPPPVVAEAPAPVAPVAPREFAVADAANFQRGCGLLRYADAVLFDVEQPVEGTRLEAATLLLVSAAEALVTSVDPAFKGAAAGHDFWPTLSKSPLPAAWARAADPATRTKLTEQEVLDVRAVAWAAVDKLDGPRRQAERKRWTRVALFTLLAVGAFSIVLAVVSAIRHRPLEPGLLVGKPVRTSSKLGRDWGSTKLLFHTDLEANPWAEWDLGQPTKLHEVVVTNRSDCCDERAIPLVVEVSDDQANWKEVARRTDRFDATMRLPFDEVTARYLRLRIARTSFLHLEAVEAH